MNRALHIPPTFPTFLTLLILSASTTPLLAEPTPTATAAFNTYAASIESRLSQQHASPTTILAPVPTDTATQTRLHHGDLILEQIKDQLTPANPNPPGAMLHHWRATVFLPNARAAALTHLLRDFAAYPTYFAPQILQATATPQSPDLIHTTLRVRQKHILTVVLDTAYDVTFAAPSPHSGFSLSRSTRIAEIDAPGTFHERPLTPAEEHGFLWRLNTYWSYEERNGGLYIQIESISLTRSIPTGLAWAIRPFVESVPRESLEFTLHSVCTALQSKPTAL
jgi:hypothetical protein